MCVTCENIVLWAIFLNIKGGLFEVVCFVLSEEGAKSSEQAYAEALGVRRAYAMLAQPSYVSSVVICRMPEHSVLPVGSDAKSYCVSSA